MKKILYLLLLILGCSLSAQELVQSTKEHLAFFPIGPNEDQVAYAANEEGFYSPGAPFVDSDARVIFYKTLKGKVFLIFNKNSISTLPYQGNFLWYRELGGRGFSSQQGVILDTDFLSYNKGRVFDFSYEKKGINLNGPGYRSYAMPWGGLIYSDQTQTGIAVVFNIENPTEEFTVIDQTRLKDWLPTQPGGFTIGADGLLYRNGLLYSAIRPKSLDNTGYRYLGRLASGHIIWTAGILGMEKYYAISNAAGMVELLFEFPWAGEYTKTTSGGYFNYGLGPWGESYCLLAPPAIDPATWYKPNPAYPAELVVVRNHLKYFGRLNDGGVRLRKEPNTTSQILGTYPNKTGFRILERTGKDETIGGSTSDWVKVRLLDGKEGWFFGAFVHNLYDGPNGTPPPWPNVPDW